MHIGYLGNFVFKIVFLFSSENHIMHTWLISRANKHPLKLCEQFEQKPNFARTWKFWGTIHDPLFGTNFNFSSHKNNYFRIENLVIRSEPFPEENKSSPPLVTTSDVSEDKKTSPTDATELSSAVAKQPVITDSSKDAEKKTTVEKKTTEDGGDDPFGALDWKDGIATLPGKCDSVL